MYITRETDYAVRISTYLARSETRAGASKLSEQNGIPSRFTLKILRKLMEGGVVKSYMGAKGGYELARPASDISLLEIIELVEGTYCFSRCLNPEHRCSNPEHSCSNHSDGCCCKPHMVYEKVTKMVREELKEQTLDKLA